MSLLPAAPRMRRLRPSRSGFLTAFMFAMALAAPSLHRTQQRDTVAIGRDNIAGMQVQRGGQRRSAGITALGIVGGGFGGYARVHGGRRQQRTPVAP